jgi:hypothetical protein
MPSRSYLRQAKLLRAMAVATPDLALRQQQLRRADEYGVLAESLPDDSPPGPVPKRQCSTSPLLNSNSKSSPTKQRSTIKSSCFRPGWPDPAYALGVNCCDRASSNARSIHSIPAFNPVPWQCSQGIGIFRS